MPETYCISDSLMLSSEVPAYQWPVSPHTSIPRHWNSDRIRKAWTRLTPRSFWTALPAGMFPAQPAHNNTCSIRPMHRYRIWYQTADTVPQSCPHPSARTVPVRWSLPHLHGFYTAIKIPRPYPHRYRCHSHIPYNSAVYKSCPSRNPSWQSGRSFRKCSNTPHPSAHGPRPPHSYNRISYSECKYRSCRDSTHG